MNFFKRMLKSKTLNFNMLVPALISVLGAFGVVIPPAVVVGILAVGNYALRFVTKVPLSEK